MSALLDKIKTGAMVVDVRTVEEFEEEHYPRAVNIPVDQVHLRLADFGDKQHPIIVYCASGSRSAYAAKILKAAGFTRVRRAAETPFNIVLEARP